MPVRFDADTHRLRLDRDTFRALVSWWSSRDARSDPRLDALRAAGVLDSDDRVHPALDPGLDAVANPICRLAVRMRDGQGRAENGDGWLNGDLTALLLDLPGGWCEFGAVHPTFLPAMLARIVELGPHPRLSGEPVQALPDQLDLLTDPDPEQRERAVRGLSPHRVAHDSLSELRRDWRVQATWNPAEGAAGVRALRVLDTPSGLWLVEPHAEWAVLFPTTPTAVWRTLTRLLPTDPELH